MGQGGRAEDRRPAQGGRRLRPVRFRRRRGSNGRRFFPRPRPAALGHGRARSGGQDGAFRRGRGGSLPDDGGEERKTGDYPLHRRRRQREQIEARRDGRDPATGFNTGLRGWHEELFFRPPDRRGAQPAVGGYAENAGGFERRKDVPAGGRRGPGAHGRKDRGRSPEAVLAGLYTVRAG